MDRFAETAELGVGRGPKVWGKLGGTAPMRIHIRNKLRKKGPTEAFMDAPFDWQKPGREQASGQLIDLRS